MNSVPAIKIVADILPFQNDVITHHLDDPNCVIKFFERLSLTFLWDIYYPRNCQKWMPGPGEWFLAIVIYGYIVFPLFSEMMKRHIKPLRIFVVAVILFWAEFYGVKRAIKWLVSMSQHE